MKKYIRVIVVDAGGGRTCNDRLYLIFRMGFHALVVRPSGLGFTFGLSFEELANGPE